MQTDAGLSPLLVVTALAAGMVSFASPCVLPLVPAYLGFIKELRQAIPGSRDAIDAVNSHVSVGALYKALKELRKLMKIEEGLLMSA